MKDFYTNAQAVREYIAMRDSGTSRNELIEQPDFLHLVGDVTGNRCLDLGCGYGYYSRLLASQGASVIGVDNAALMLEEAERRASGQDIQYLLKDVEEVEFPAESFDLIISNLTFHYVRDIAALFEKLYAWLRPASRLVFTIEHPIYTANRRQDPPEWCDIEAHTRWIVSDYFHSGERFGFFGRKYHRTLAEYFAALAAPGFHLLQLVEPSPTPSVLSAHPRLAEDMQRPLFLGMNCGK